MHQCIVAWNDFRVHDVICCCPLPHNLTSFLKSAIFSSDMESIQCGVNQKSGVFRGSQDRTWFFEISKNKAVLQTADLRFGDHRCVPGFCVKKIEPKGAGCCDINVAPPPQRIMEKGRPPLLKNGKIIASPKWPILSLALMAGFTLTTDRNCDFGHFLSKILSIISKKYCQNCQIFVNKLFCFTAGCVAAGIEAGSEALGSDMAWRDSQEAMQDWP